MVRELIRDHYWSRIIRKQRIWERRFWEMTRNYFRELRDSILRRLDEAEVQRYLSQCYQVKGVLEKDSTVGALQSILLFTEAEKRKLQERGDTLFRALFEEVGKAEMRGLGVAIDFDVLDPDVAEWIRKKTLKFSDEVLETTQQALKDQLVQAVMAGESIEQIKDRVREVFSGTVRGTAPRARLIARTETISAFNAARWFAHRQSRVVEAKEWLTAKDERVRPLHVEADGQTVGVTEKFVVGGFLMDFPGDPTAPPHLICNCRCTIMPVVAKEAITPGEEKEEWAPETEEEKLWGIKFLPIEDLLNADDDAVVQRLREWWGADRVQEWALEAQSKVFKLKMLQRNARSGEDLEGAITDPVQAFILATLDDVFTAFKSHINSDGAIQKRWVASKAREWYEIRRDLEELLAGDFSSLRSLWGRYPRSQRRQRIGRAAFYLKVKYGVQMEWDEDNLPKEEWLLALEKGLEVIPAHLRTHLVPCKLRYLNMPGAIASAWCGSKEGIVFEISGKNLYMEICAGEPDVYTHEYFHWLEDVFVGLFKSFSNQVEKFADKDPKYLTRHQYNNLQQLQRGGYSEEWAIAGTNVFYGKTRGENHPTIESMFRKVLGVKL